MKTIKAEDIAKKIHGELIGDGALEVRGINSLAEAGENEASFIVSEKYKDLLARTKAKVILAPVSLKEKLPEDKTYILCDNPNIIFGRLVEIFAPPMPDYGHGIHPTAVIEPGAEIPASCHIGACVVISKNVILGENARILPGVFIGEDTKIGRNTIIYPNCVIRERTIIGNNVIIHSGVCIGSDGFGYEATPFGLVKIPQTGTVKIEDEVEIGSNSTIDRARFGVTLIKTGVKIDNLVQVAHNVEVGEFSLLIAQSGIAGSSKLGQGVILAGQAGVSHGLKVGDGAKIAGQAGVTQDVPPGQAYAGTTAEPAREFMERMMVPKRLKKLTERVKFLEEVLKKLQEQKS